MTIKQIAEKAGTSRGTVDRVLNGRGNVNPELAKRILDIAERERYQPNQLAQALIRSRQRTHIGMVIPSVGNPFFDEVLRGAQSRARKLSSYGTTLIIREIKGYDAATQLQAMRRLVAEGVDALAVMPLDVPEVAAVTAHTGGHSQHRYRCRPCGLCRLRLLQQRYDHRRSGAAHAQWPGPRGGCYRQH